MKPFFLELSSDDFRLLETIARKCGQSKAQIMRWALRHFALTGSWPKNSRERMELVGRRYLETGIERGCV
jgi:predicted transcriptional regulator